MHGAIEGLARERLLMNGAVRIAVEEAADVVFKLADTRRRGADQQPGELLVVEPGTALDRVHEMALDGVVRGERDVVAALHHARAAALAEQTLHRDGHVEIGTRLLGVQCGEKARTAGAEDQDVGLKGSHCARV